MQFIFQLYCFTILFGLLHFDFNTSCPGHLKFNSLSIYFMVILVWITLITNNTNFHSLQLIKISPIFCQIHYKTQWNIYVFFPQSNKAILAKYLKTRIHIKWSFPFLYFKIFGNKITWIKRQTHQQVNCYIRNHPCSCLFKRNVQHCKNG